jgi:hypothetical protein
MIFISTTNFIKLKTKDMVQHLENLYKKQELENFIYITIK